MSRGLLLGVAVFLGVTLVGFAALFWFLNNDPKEEARVVETPAGLSLRVAFIHPVHQRPAPALQRKLVKAAEAGRLRLIPCIAELYPRPETIVLTFEAGSAYYDDEGVFLAPGVGECIEEALETMQVDVEGTHKVRLLRMRDP